MKYTVGIDLGSTTTKAVVLGESGAVLGRGITNSRSNYDTACRIALSEALTNARFSLIAHEMERYGVPAEKCVAMIGALERRFRAEQYRSQLTVLSFELRRFAGRLLTAPPQTGTSLDAIVSQMDGEVDGLFAAGARRKSDFFRDLAGSRYLQLAEEQARTTGAGFESLASLFDKAILDVENSAEAAGRFEDHARAAHAGSRSRQAVSGMQRTGA